MDQLTTVSLPLLRANHKGDHTMSVQSGSGRPAINRNMVFAAIFFVISAVMGIHAYTGMKVGTMDNMGPGFFPVMLSVILGILSIMVGFTSLPKDAQKLKSVNLKSLLLVIVAPLIFAVTIRWLGMVLAIFLTTFVVSFASRHAKLLNSLALAAGFTLFCVILFAYLLNLPIPLWGDLFIT